MTSNESGNRKKTIFYLASLVTVSLVLFGVFLIFLFRGRSHRIPRIRASGETAPTLGRGKAACAIAICLHPSDPARTMLVTADRSIGLLTYNLEGGQIEVVHSGRVNSVDVCYNFPYQEEKITLIASSNRSRQGIDFYRVDFRNQKLQFINTVALPFDPVLCALAFSHRDQCYYLFVSTKGRSDVMHYQLIGETVGNIKLKLLRRLKFESPVISIAADEDNAALFCSAKAQGIWRLHLDPGVDDTWKTLILDVKKMKRLGKELRGLSLYPYQDGGGCFVFSDTENSRFAIIERLPPHRYIGSFRITTGKYDRVTHSLDTALTPISLGKKYPTGLFVCQDELNEDGQRQTYKLIHWDEIVHCFPDSLKIDLLVDPRKIGPHHKLP